MSQTTDAMSGLDCPIEISTDDTAWSNISGSTSSIEPSAQTRQTGVKYTLDGDYPIITTGKREPMEIEVKIIYTATVGEAFEIVRAAFEAGSPLYVRWSPAGGQPGDQRFTSGKGVVTEFLYPGASGEDPGPLAGSFKLQVPRVIPAAVPAI
jgi:hypothetical protein